MISIIVPMYNASATLGRCLDSILAQSYTDFELLCIDDGSADDTLQLLRQYEVQDSRVRVFSQKNGGVSAARNVGIDESKGEFITFADGDDWVEESWLKDYMDNYQGEDLLFQNAVWEKPDGSQFNRSIEVDRECRCGDKIIRLYDYNTINYVWAALFRRSIIVDNNIRYNTDIAYNEDCEFVLHYCKYVADINITPLPIRNYHYIFPDDSRSYQQPSYKRALALKLVAQRGLEMCKVQGVRFDSINLRTSTDMIYTLIMAYKIGLPQEQRARILELVATLPYKRKVNKFSFRVLSAIIALNMGDLFLRTIYRNDGK
ncbi:MAG: glycosyltransferase family A protein [Rikenellaceae bacterium]